MLEALTFEAERGSARDVAETGVAGDTPKRVLVVDDEPSIVDAVATVLRYEGYEVATAAGGYQALALAQGEPFDLVVLDVMLPDLDGLEVTRRLRQDGVRTPVLFLTAKDALEDKVSGLTVGGDDYVTKPFQPAELRARVGVGIRVLDLQSKLAVRINELEAALKQVKQLRGLLPICMYCKKIRNDGDYWQQVETYISDHTEAEFSHGICPECYEKLIKSQLE